MFMLDLIIHGTLWDEIDYITERETSWGRKIEWKGKLLYYFICEIRNKIQ